MRSTARSMTLAAVHSGSRRHPSYRNLFNTSIPRGVWATSGWNWTAYRPRAGSSMAATGVDWVRAVTANPAGASVTVSEWLIHTDPSWGRSARSTPGDVTA